MTLRLYQREAVAAVRTGYVEGDRSTLLVMATGLGKTHTFVEIARMVADKGGRTLVLAHRDELIRQAADKLHAAGVEPGIEKADERATDESVVVASVQTLRGNRLASWNKDAFRLVVVDECHHAPADSYRAILDHFSSARVLGVTATPDRLDGAAMAGVFDSVAYRYELRQAIADGWLAPIRAQRVHVEGLDLSAVRTARGDLHTGDLDVACRNPEAVRGVAEPLPELASDRPTILFAVTVAHARELATELNRRQPGCARALDGSAAPHDRQRVLQQYEAGEFHFLVNCQLFTEGFDSPRTSCIAIARPTGSRALYCQMVGRGTRLAEGKTDCLVLDFAGNAGRHSLAGPVDVLAGKEPDEVRALAAELLESGPREIGEALQEAQEILAKHQTSQVVSWWAEVVDPFVTVTGVSSAPWAGDSVSDKQRAYLERKGFTVPIRLSRGKAAALISALRDREQRGLASYKQVRWLQRQGVDARAMSFEEASALIDRRIKRRREAA